MEKENFRCFFGNWFKLHCIKASIRAGRHALLIPSISSRYKKGNSKWQSQQHNFLSLNEIFHVTRKLHISKLPGMKGNFRKNHGKMLGHSTMVGNYVKYFPAITCNHTKYGIVGGFLRGFESGHTMVKDLSECLLVYTIHNQVFGWFKTVWISAVGQDTETCYLHVFMHSRKTIFVFCSPSLTGKNFNRKEPHRN